MKKTQPLKWIPWHKYTEAHMNEHMSEHQTHSKRNAFTWFDLELCYLLWYKTEDFQTICQNRIIKTLSQQTQMGIKRKLWIVKSFHNSHDIEIVHPYTLCYQAQNLVYMYALGLVDILDKELVKETRDTTVRNWYRRAKQAAKLDCIIPIFDSIIWMQDEISLDNVEEVREYYLHRKHLAEEIKHQSKHHRLKLHDTIFLTEQEKAMVS